MPAHDDRHWYLDKARGRLRTITIVVFAAGLLFLFLRPRMADWLGGPLRDLGIALITAALVTLIYERYARERAAAENVDDILEKVIGDVVDKQVWREMRDQILSKTAIRRTMSVGLKMQRRPELVDNRCVLHVLMQYRLSSLLSYPQDVNVLHGVDNYMRASPSDLPRLLRVQIDGKLATLTNRTRFEQPVTLAGRDADVPVVVEREELVYVPGACTFVMSECTELEAVSLWEVPGDIKVEVALFSKVTELTTADAFRVKRLLLPGQCLEFHFTGRPPVPAEQPSSAASARAGSGARKRPRKP